jgi:hypothetical protein
LAYPDRPPFRRSERSFGGRGHSREPRIVGAGTGLAEGLATRWERPPDGAAEDQRRGSAHPRNRSPEDAAIITLAAMDVASGSLTVEATEIRLMG